MKHDVDPLYHHSFVSFILFIPFYSDDIMGTSRCRKALATPIRGGPGCPGEAASKS